jgi:transcriptional regulator with XRE-family HTH domain
MMRRARKREGLRICRAAWLIGVSGREYREIEAGDRFPSLSTYERISELYGFTADVRGIYGPCVVNGLGVPER